MMSQQKAHCIYVLPIFMWVANNEVPQASAWEGTHIMFYPDRDGCCGVEAAYIHTQMKCLGLHISNEGLAQMGAS